MEIYPVFMDWKKLILFKTVLPKVMNRVNAIPITILMAFFHRNKIIITLEFIGNHPNPE